jgi:hypothetical protein
MQHDIEVLPGGGSGDKTFEKLPFCQILVQQFHISNHFPMNGKFPWIEEMQSECEGVTFESMGGISLDNGQFFKKDVVYSSCTFTYQSASILPFTFDQRGCKVFLLGKETRGWSDFGGNRSCGDISAKETAIREFIEETKGLLQIPKTLRWVGRSSNHRMYMGEIEIENEEDDEFYLSGIIRKIKETRSTVGKDNEKTDFGWVYGSDIIQILKSQKMDTAISIRCYRWDENEEKMVWDIAFVIKNMAKLLKTIPIKMFII